MLKILKNNNSQVISLTIAIFFVLTLLTDFHYKYTLRFDLPFPKELVYLKLAIGLFFITAIVFSFKVADFKKSLYLFGGIIICSAIGFVYADSVNWNYILYIQAQYFFGIISFFFFVNFYKKLKLKPLNRVVEMVLWVNFVLILIGYFFELPLLKTYTSRFGVDGLFKSTSVTSYFYMFCLILFLSKKKTRYVYLIIVNIILSSLMVGSKTLYVFLIILLFYFFVKKGAELVKSKKLFYGFFLGTVSVASVFLIKPILSLNVTLRRVLDEHGLVTAIFSFRDLLAKEAFQQAISEFTLINYLFGGVEHIHKLAQIAGVDLFLSFGIIGSLLIVWLFIINFPKIQNKNVKFMLYCIIVLIILRGNFLYYPSELFIAMTIFAMTLKTIDSEKELRN